jgi:D-alanyl-D-alanine carboxypeptidase (penicillin-binding protein 5/6)
LISSAEAGEESYMAAVIGATSDDERFAGSQRILEYAFDNYKREVIVPKDKTYEKIDAPFRRDESVKLAAAEDVEVLVGPGAKIEQRVTKDKPPASVGKGDEIGKVEVLLDGQNVGEAPLVAAKGYEEAGFFQKNWYRLRGLFD